MEIFGKDYGFLYSVGAEQELTTLCGGDLGRIKDYMTGEAADAVAFRRELICILSRWHEKRRAFEEPGYEPAPLTPALIDLLDMQDFKILQAEAFCAFKQDSARTVEAAEPKKKEAVTSG